MGRCTICLAPGNRAQGIFAVNFLANVVTTARKKPPFGIDRSARAATRSLGQISSSPDPSSSRQMAKALRRAGDDTAAKEWHQYWIDNRLQWYIDLGYSLSGEPVVVGAPQRQAVMAGPSHLRPW